MFFKQIFYSIVNNFTSFQKINFTFITLEYCHRSLQKSGNLSQLGLKLSKVKRLLACNTMSWAMTYKLYTKNIPLSNILLYIPFILERGFSKTYLLTYLLCIYPIFIKDRSWWDFVIINTNNYPITANIGTACAAINCLLYFFSVFDKINFHI